MPSQDDSKLDLHELIRGYEGREIQADMHAWFTLARRGADIQSSLRINDKQIKECQRQIKDLLEDKQKLVSIESNILDSMNLVLPKGGGISGS
jgi:hypothetical protein